VVVTAIAVLAFVAFDPGTLGTRIREAIGAEGRIHPEVEEQGIPGGHYEFLATQRGSDDPVRWNPCREIHYVVNPEGSPPDWEALVDDGFDEVEDRTGLAFRYDGTTDDRSFDDRFAADGDALPVLVGWADDEEVPDLEGDVAGVGGSTAVGTGNGRRFYVTGMVVLDAEQFADFDDDEQQFAQAIVDHEFGHLVGLGHVDDPGELMNEDNLGATTYGPGDREGLARLGSIRC
jgi:hypothetical protein